MTDMNIAYLSLTQMHPDPENLNQHNEASQKSLRYLLSHFGQIKPIVVDSEFRILAGNGTYMAAQSLGWTHLHAVVTPLEGDAAREFAIGDNRSASLSYVDPDAFGTAMASMADSFQDAMDFRDVIEDLDAMADDDDDALADEEPDAPEAEGKADYDAVVFSGTATETALLRRYFDEAWSRWCACGEVGFCGNESDTPTARLIQLLDMLRRIQPEGT